MPSSKINDYSTRCLQFLASQFDDADNLKGFIQAIIESVQDCEDVADDLLTDRLDFWTATGIQLDNIGTIIGVLRAGLPDALYRIQIAYAIIRNGLLPTPNDFIQAVVSLTESTYTRYWELVPAAIQIHFNGTVPVSGGTPTENNAIFVDLVDDMAPAGVSVILVKEYILPGHEPFVFVNDDKTNPNRGDGFTELGPWGGNRGFFSERIV